MIRNALRQINQDTIKSVTVSVITAGGQHKAWAHEVGIATTHTPAHTGDNSFW
jgi:hypothetical protein